MKYIVEKIDLTKQVTDELKSKWFYKDYADRLVVKKEEVIFDKDFHFTFDEVDLKEVDESAENYVRVMLNGEMVHGIDSDMIYSFDWYGENPKYILQDICVYIANQI